MSAVIISATVIDRRHSSKPHFHSAVCCHSQRGKSENLCVMLIGEIVDSSKDRHVWVNFVFGRDVYEIVIFDVEIWSAEIDFFARIDTFRLDRRAQFFPPQIGTGNINFVAWPSWQSRALGLGNIRLSKSSRPRDKCNSRENRDRQSASRAIPFRALRFRRPQIQS